MGGWMGLCRAGNLLAAALLALGLWLMPVPAAGAADPGRVRIAVLASHQEGPYMEVIEAFRHHLQQVEAAPEMEMFPMPEQAAQLAACLEEVRSFGPDLILALGTPALQAVNGSIRDIPVVFAMVLNTVSLPRAANVTGVILEFPIMTQLEWLKKILPNVRTVGVVFNPQENAGRIAAARKAAAELGLTLDARPIDSPRQLPAALEDLTHSAEALWGIPDQMVVTPQTARNLLLYSFRNRIPFIGLSPAWVKAGALFALDWNYRDIGLQCAEQAVQILRGVKASALAVHPPPARSASCSTAEPPSR